MSEPVTPAGHLVPEELAEDALMPGRSWELLLLRNFTEDHARKMLGLPPAGRDAAEED